jgi:TadE-like protein
MRVFKARDRSDRGAVLVEMAIVVPIFILLVFGMLEFGLAFKDKLTMAHAASQASRRATVMGNDAFADLEILNAVKEGLSGAASVDAIVHVDIFFVNSDGSKGDYDRYVPDSVSVPGCDWDPCPDPAIVDPVIYGSPDDYPPCERDIYLDVGDGVDTIGVEIQYTHSWVTGVLGFSTATWTEIARSRMEPDLFGTDESTC